jgi:hypothetical protein
MDHVRLYSYSSKLYQQLISLSFWIRIFFLLLLVVLVFRVPLFMKQATKGFHLARFELDYDWSKMREMDGCFADAFEEKRALDILKQPFTYLDRGAQCYVFESQDRQYVIKIFQENRCATPFSQWKKKNRRKKMLVKRNGEIDFRPCFIAYSLVKEETALLYLHLLPTKDLLPRLSVQSPLGQWVSLPLDRYSFVIQKKVRPFLESLLQASLEGKLPVYLSSFFSLLDRRLAKGIRNEDTSLSSNFGFLGDQAIEIDFGRYLQSSAFLLPDFQKAERVAFVCKLKSFIQTYLPHELDALEKILSEEEWGRL